MTSRAVGQRVDQRTDKKDTRENHPSPHAVKNNTSLRFSKKKEALIKAGDNLFNKYGLKKVSVEEICRKAEVSRMTFYKYFANKLDLADHIWQGWIEEGREVADRIEGMDITFPEKLTKILAYKMKRSAEINPELIMEYLSHDIISLEAVDFITEFIERARKRGDIRKEIKPAFIMAVMEKMQELAQNTELMAQYKDFSEFTREMFTFFYYGVLPQKGEKS